MRRRRQRLVGQEPGARRSRPDDHDGLHGAGAGVGEVDGPHVGDARTRAEVLHQLLSEDGRLADEQHADGDKDQLEDGVVDGKAHLPPLEDAAAARELDELGHADQSEYTVEVPNVRASITVSLRLCQRDAGEPIAVWIVQGEDEV